MTGNKKRARFVSWALIPGALVCLSLSQLPASAQAESAQSDGDALVSSDGSRIAAKAASGSVSVSFAGTGRELKFGETDDSLANYSSRESAAEYRRLLKARPISGPWPSGSIIGPDQRVRVNPTTSYPARATVLIVFDPPGPGTAICTGWLIGKDTVATAGHCVAKGGSGVFYPRSTYRIFPGRNGTSAPYGSCTVQRLFTNSTWLNSGFDNYDYGMIKLNCNIGNTTGWYGFFWQAASLVGLPVITQGYPGDKPLTQWRSTDQVRANDARRVFYKADTVGGQSGSPVWYNRPNCGKCGMAIHAYGTGGTGVYANNNHGTRINKQVFQSLLHVKNLP
jgi:glutamyl endopeptidase